MTREDDINKLIDAVLEISAVFFDNPNGAYEVSCPFCGGIKYFGGNVSTPTMTDIKHDLNCAYLIAKDLNTGR
jgi:hypothetical protein